MHESTTGSPTSQFLEIDCTQQKAYLHMHIFTRKVHRSSIAKKATINFQCLQIKAMYPGNMDYIQVSTVLQCSTMSFHWLYTGSTLKGKRKTILHKSRMTDDLFPLALQHPCCLWHHHHHSQILVHSEVSKVSSWNQQIWPPEFLFQPSEDHCL